MSLWGTFSTRHGVFWYEWGMCRDRHPSPGDPHLILSITAVIWVSKQYNVVTLGGGSWVVSSFLCQLACLHFLPHFISLICSLSVAPGIELMTPACLWRLPLLHLSSRAHCTANAPRIKTNSNCAVYYRNLEFSIMVTSSIYTRE